MTEQAALPGGRRIHSSPPRGGEQRTDAPATNAAKAPRCATASEAGYLHRDEVTPIPKRPKVKASADGVLRYKSAKRRAEERALRLAQADTLVRSKGRCEAIPRGLEHLCTGLGTEYHHVLPRSRGGQHHPDNLVHLCLTAHRLVHAQPDRARRLGLLA